jgi:hypothetical protein
MESPDNRLSCSGLIFTSGRAPPETPEIYPVWKALLHAVTHLLTFNVGHFTGMAGFGPGVVVVDPTSL